jgi:hypothetical protein
MMYQQLEHDSSAAAWAFSRSGRLGGGLRNLTCRTLGCLACLVLPAIATDIRWTAAGTVTSVGSGFAAGVGDPVSVKFSYDSGATPRGIRFLQFSSATFAEAEFCNAISLIMEVTIGTQVWSGRVSASPPSGTLALVTEAWEGGDISAEKFTVLASSTDAGVFEPFPYTGSTPERSIQVMLTDATSPYAFLTPLVLPGADTPVGEITAGSGYVAAGADRIDFTIHPASVTVVGIEPAFALKLTTTPTGIELRWPSVVGTNYRLEEGDTLADWEPYSTYPGTGAEIVVPMEPFTDHPRQRFYRVVKVE